MKKIYSLVAAVCVALAVNAADPVALIDCNFTDIDGSAWTSANQNWDWDQQEKDADDNWIAHNIFKPGQTINIALEFLIDDVPADFDGDSIVIFYGYFSPGGNGVGNGWGFLNDEAAGGIPNTIMTNITDWASAKTYAYSYDLAADAMTTAQAKEACTQNDGKEIADNFYMIQMKGYKGGSVYGPANINMNFTIKADVSADDVAADAAVVYPNPVAAGAAVTIEGEYTVANVAGAIVAAGADELDTSDLNAGIYFVSVAGEVVKLVVE